MQDAKTVHLTIDSQFKNVFLVGLAVRGICSYLPLNETDVFQAEVCVVEAVNNVIKHAYNGESGHDVDVIISLHPNRVAFQICDSGKTFELKKEVATMNFDAKNIETLPESGIGLHIIHAVMEDVTYETLTGRNILTMSKRFSKGTS